MTHLQDATAQAQELVDFIDQVPALFADCNPEQKEFLKELQGKALVLQATLVLAGGE